MRSVTDTTDTRCLQLTDTNHSHTVTKQERGKTSKAAECSITTEGLMLHMTATTTATAVFVARWQGSTRMGAAILHTGCKADAVQGHAAHAHTCLLCVACSDCSSRLKGTPSGTKD